MKQFNHRRAWKTWALPKFFELPQNVRDLVGETYQTAESLNQKKDLSMPWPDSSDLRIGFDDIPVELLAEAAGVVYSWGHWGPGLASVAGTYWNFSAYADQSLAARIGDMPKYRNAHFEIHQGKLRICAAGRDFWTWHEVCLATPDNYAKAHKIAQELIPGFCFYEQLGEVAEAIKAELKPNLFDTDAFMDEDSPDPFSAWIV